MPLKFKSRVEGQLCVFEKVVASEGQPFGSATRTAAC